jgi:hypothetical protein
MRILQYVSYLALYVWSADASANESAYMNAYYNEPISSCEIRNLASYWKTDVTDTKLSIGKAAAEQKDLLSTIQKANAQARTSGIKDCDFWSLDFTYEDAELMGAAWGVDTYEAKMKLAAISAQKSFKEAQKIVLANKKPVSKNQSPEDAFFASHYDWCHAKMLAKAYRIKEVYEAKIWMGNLIRSGDSGLLETKMSYARKQALTNLPNRCDFFETRFSYKDAEKLASMWSISTSEAKVALQDKYLSSGEMRMEQMLKK